MPDTNSEMSDRGRAAQRGRRAIAQQMWFLEAIIMRAATSAEDVYRLRRAPLRDVGLSFVNRCFDTGL